VLERLLPAPGGEGFTLTAVVYRHKKSTAASLLIEAIGDLIKIILNRQEDIVEQESEVNRHA